MMWEFLDDDIYITIISGLEGYKKKNTRGKGFPVPRF